MAKRPRYESDSADDGVSSMSTQNVAASRPGICHATENPPKLSLTDATRHSEVMRCELPPHQHGLSFSSFDQYDVHYQKEHVNRCVECRKNFPTPHYLDLHQQENHNPLIAVLRERGERTVSTHWSTFHYSYTDIAQYGCFVESCDRKCSTPQKRRLHLVDKHMFPKDYDFFIVNTGIDQKTSMLMTHRHRRKSSAARTDRVRRSEVATSVEAAATSSGLEPDEVVSYSESFEHGLVSTTEQREAQNMDILTSSITALRFVPPSVRFGQSAKGRGGLGQK